MDLRIAATDNPTVLMRRAGYAFQKHAAGGQTAWVRPLSRGDFPRFHIYAREEGLAHLMVSIHLDARRETHGAQRAHGGEYDEDGALADEIARLRTVWKVEG